MALTNNQPNDFLGAIRGHITSPTWFTPGTKSTQAVEPSGHSRGFPSLLIPYGHKLYCICPCLTTQRITYATWSCITAGVLVLPFASAIDPSREFALHALMQCVILNEVRALRLAGACVCACVCVCVCTLSRVCVRVSVFGTAYLQFINCCDSRLL
jgi:hypothetical protein